MFHVPDFIDAHSNLPSVLLKLIRSFETPTGGVCSNSVFIIRFKCKDNCSFIFHKYTGLEEVIYVIDHLCYDDNL